MSYDPPIEPPAPTVREFEHAIHEISDALGCGCTVYDCTQTAAALRAEVERLTHRLAKRDDALASITETAERRGAWLTEIEQALGFDGKRTARGEQARALAARIAETEAEVARLTQERDDWMARAHTYDVERQQYHAARDDAQARLAALCAKGVAADDAVHRYALAVDWDNSPHGAGCGCAQCELRGAFYRFREALAAAQSGDGRKEDGDE